MVKSVCEGCPKRDGKQLVCTVFNEGKVPHLYKTHNACPFNPPKVVETRKRRVRVGQQKTNRGRI